MNLATARSRVRSLANIRSASLLPDADIDGYLAEFTAELVDRYIWPQFVHEVYVPLVVGYSVTGNVAAGSPIDRVLSVGLNGEPLGRMSDADARLDIKEPVAPPPAPPPSYLETGTPTSYRYSQGDNVVHLRPVPTEPGYLKFVYLTSPPAPANDNIATGFDDSYHMGWCYYAALSALGERAGNQQKMADFAARVNQYVSRMRRRYLFGSEWETWQMPQRWNR